MTSSCLPPSVEQKPTCIPAMSAILYQESIPNGVMPEIGKQASIFEVLQMDPRLPPAGMTKKVRHARYV